MALKQDEERLQEQLDQSGIPEYMHGALIRYICKGIPPGDFLEALLSNDLSGTYRRADSVNQTKVLEYIKFLYNYAPSGCWGSEDNYCEWCKHRGFFGLELDPKADSSDTSEYEYD